MKRKADHARPDDAETHSVKSVLLAAWDDMR